MNAIRAWRCWLIRQMGIGGGLVLLGIGLSVYALWIVPAWGHDWYAGQASKRSTELGHYSCCNQRVDHPGGYSGDCKPVSATMRGAKWIFVYDGKEYEVPDNAMMPDETNGQPLEAHGCVNQDRVLCFWRRAAGG